MQFGSNRQNFRGEAVTRDGGGRDIEDDIKTEEDGDVEDIEEDINPYCVKWYFKLRDKGNDQRNDPFNLDISDPAGCGCELCDIVARLALWSIKLVDPEAQVDNMVDLEFVPISSLSFGWPNGLIEIRLYTEVSATHTEPLQVPGVDQPDSPELQSCRLSKGLSCLDGHHTIARHHPSTLSEISLMIA